MHHSQHSLCTGLPYWWSHSLYITTVYSTWWPLSVLSGGPPDDLCTVITACCAFQSIWWPLSVISPLYCTNAHSDPLLVTSLCTIFTECCTLWPPLFTYCTVTYSWWPLSVPLSLYHCMYAVPVDPPLCTAITWWPSWWPLYCTVRGSRATIRPRAMWSAATRSQTTKPWLIDCFAKISCQLKTIKQGC